ncbi:protein NRT1/ PTR FAMILY 2.6-like isoform X2 [Chenopodium quinoa]|nr:protein NRT1/ PTR FAMILY 2.6-like isoform X2 [Chenopodium quinoa]
MIGISLAASAWNANLVVYAIEQYNMKEITAAKLYNIVIGGMTLVSVISAVLADSFFGSFTIFIVASFVSLIGVVLFTISATVPSLRPELCIRNNLVECEPPSTVQHGFLYATIALAVIGAGGTNFLLGTIGADQYPNSPKHRQVFFNWFLGAHEIGEVIGYTAVVYLQSNVNWGIGFGIGVAGNALAILLFCCGSCFYRRVMPRGGSPFTSIARVVVAYVRKLKTNATKSEIDGNPYFYGTSTSSIVHRVPPTNSLRFLNRAALGRTDDNDVIASQRLKKSWSLCTVEEVEDFKRFIRVLPIWSSGLVSSIIFGVNSSLVVLQALVMDRSMGAHFKIPAGSMLIFIIVSTCLMIFILDRIMYPLVQHIIRRTLTPLESIGFGYLVNVLSAVAFALVEMKRLDLVKTKILMDKQAQVVAPMSVFWLVVPLGLMGIGSAFYFPTLMSFYYQELPISLKNTANAMIALQFSVGSYLGIVFLSVVQHSTSWLPDDINHGNADYLYWTLTILGFISFLYYLLCAKLYKYDYSDGHIESISRDH